MKDKAIHYFRGLAILFIIAGHALSNTLELLNVEDISQEYLAKFFYNLILGGTGLFVFISGFLFHSVFSKKFSYGRFLSKKIKNVYIPYIIMSIYPIIKIFFIDKNYDNYNVYPNFLGGINIFNSGLQMTGYWYINFIMIIFLMSPLYLEFIKTNKKEFILFISFVISLLSFRPIQNINHIHSVIYFNFFYLFGIWVSLNKEKLLIRLKKMTLIFGSLLVVVCLIQTFYLPYIGNFHKKLFEFQGIDFMLIQKIIMILFLLSILEKIKDRELRVFDKLAEYSFAIYFLHGYIMRIFTNRVFYKINDLNLWSIFLIETLFLLLLSISITIFIKKILGKKSRYLIGY